MEKRKINQLIRQARIDAGVSQKEARRNVMDAASYSRFENGKREVYFDKIITILDNLGVSFTDFIHSYVHPELSDIRITFAKFIKKINDKNTIKSVVTLFNELNSRYDSLTVVELGIYFDIKAILHKKYPDLIPPITQKELSDVLKIFKTTKKKKFLSEDYRMLSHVVMNMKKNEIYELTSILFPIEESSFKTELEKKYLSNYLINSITPMLMGEEYDVVNYLLKIVKNHSFLYNDSYFFMSQFTYLEHLYLFLTQGDLEHMNKVYEIVNAIAIIGDEDSAKLMKKETKKLFKKAGRESNSNYDLIIEKK